MSNIRHLLLVLILVGTSYADPNTEEAAFLAVPGAAWRYSNTVPRVFQRAELPAELLKKLHGYDWGTEDERLPKEFHGFTLDLNKDGKSEYFIETIYGGSGGPAYMIFSPTANGWRVIGGYQGILHVMADGTGWPALVTTARGGGGNYSKTFHQFRNEKYTETNSERYERGKITKRALANE